MHAGTGPCIAQEAQANRGRVSAFRLDVRGCNEARCCRCGEMRKMTEPIRGLTYRVPTLPAFATIPTSLLFRCRGAHLGEKSPQNARLRTKTSKSDACLAGLCLADILSLGSYGQKNCLLASIRHSKDRDTDRQQASFLHNVSPGLPFPLLPCFPLNDQPFIPSTISPTTKVPTHPIHRQTRLEKCYLQSKCARGHLYETKQKKG